MQDYAIPAIVLIANLALGFFAFFRDPYALINRLFLIFSFVITIWGVASSVSDVSENTAVISAASHTAFGAGFLMLVVAYAFSSALIKKPLKKTIPIAIISIGTFAAIVFSTDAVYKVTSSTQAQDGVLYPIYILSLIILLGVVARNFVKGLKSNNPKLRLQSRTILWGFMAASLLILFSNAVIPYFFSSADVTTRFGPLFTFIFIASISYAVQKHGLFDVRAFIARSVAYVLVLATLGAALTIVLLTLTNIFFQDQQVGIGVRAVYIIIALLLSLVFQPLKRFFDKITNSIFYRDAYDPQAALDRLSELLVGTVELDKIEGGTSRILQDTLRSSTVNFLLKTTQDGMSSKALGLLLKQSRDIVIFDEIEVHKQEFFHELLGTKDIAVGARLRTTHGDLGFMLLGFKRSGSIYSDNDIRLLGIIADEVAVGLQNALRFEEIKQFNITLQEKIDEATKQLRHANHKLKELDATKDEFISMASHQLRTPLTTIKGYLSMVLEGDVGPVKKTEREMIQHAFDGAEQMVFLIADLLNISRLQSGKFVIENKPTDLAKMVEAQVEQLRATADNHKLTMTYVKPENFPILNLDETKIRQVIMNFMDNAIYYTPSGGSIEVKLESTDKAINYTVTDTGLGVPKAEQHHLFSKFYRAGNARKMRPDGTGLGLFMAKKVIVAQGGSIIFNSTEGEGSTFGFSFPRDKMEVKK